MEKEPYEGVYIISIAAKLAEMHPQTLRMYERKGLLRPSRTPKNRRRYSDEDIRRLRRIQELTQREGLNLEGVKKVLEMEEEIASLKKEIEQLRSELENAESRVRDQIDQLKRQFAISRAKPMSIVIRRD